MGLVAVEAQPDATAQRAAPPRPVFDLIPGLGAKEIDRELRLADRQSDVGTRRLAFYLADMANRGICQLLGYPTATVYAVKRLEMGRRNAQMLIAAGRALEELPLIDAAFCEGRINWSRVRLLTKIAVQETEAAWLERALTLGWADFEREVLTSERGRPPRAGRKGLRPVKVGIAAKVDRLLYLKWELAKRKLGDERGEPATDADLMERAAQLMLSTREDGTVPGRERLNDSIYRIVVDRCSDCQATYLQTPEGPAELSKAMTEAIGCDAKVEVMEPAGPKGVMQAATAHEHAAPTEHAPPTPAWMRAKVLARDGYACRICGSHVDVQAHHVAWRSAFGRTRPDNLAGVCARCHALVHENLVFVSGTAPHDLRITDREGTELARSPEAIGAGIRRLPSLTGILEDVSESKTTLSAVTFQTLPASVDAEWFSRHVNLFKWNSSHGEMTFEAGSPMIEPLQSPAEVCKPILDQCGEPVALDRLVGQARVVAVFASALAAAQIRRKPLPHVLLLGEAGLGKSTLARAVANQMGCAVSMTSGPLIKDPAVLIKMLTGLRPGQVLFIDEIHGLPRAAAETLYEAMEDGVLRLPVTDGHRSKTIQIGVNPFTLIGATTELGGVPGPLQSRFTIREYLDSYADQEIADVVKRAVGKDRLEIEEVAAMSLARLAHGVPRDAIKLSARVLDLALAQGCRTIDSAFVDQSLRKLGIDERGLGPVEQKALGALERHGRGRPMGISRWSATSGICTAVLRQCEPMLIRLGLMAVTPRGRMAVG